MSASLTPPADARQPLDPSIVEQAIAWHVLLLSGHADEAQIGASMGIIALLIHSGTDFNLQIPANAATLIVLCAIAVLAGSHNNQKTRRNGAPTE